VTQETSGRGQADAANIDKVLRSISSASLGELMSIWRARAHEEGSGSPAVFRCLGERVLAQGEPLLAYDVVSAGLGIWPKDVRLRQLQGLALSRSGATERANAVLENLRREEEAGEETLGMIGRTYKDLAATAATRKQRSEFLRRAAETYTQAYEATGGYWTGINAATMNLLIGETELAQELARKVRSECLEEIADPSGDQYWGLAALGEASLVLRDQSQAREWYARAAEVGKNRFGDLHSTRHNARLILQHWNEDQAWIEEYLCIPCVLVFAGHMIDRPDRATPRFPRELESAVAKEIQRKIDMLKPGFGFASAACGSDILFLEAMQDVGAEVSVVLPYNEEDFVGDSVDFIPNSQWRGRFERVLTRSARVITASTQRIEIGGISYEFCSQLLLGLAAIRCRQLDSTLIPLAIWNEKPGDGPGGTASVVENWRKLGYEPEIINLEKICGRSGPLPAGRQRRPLQESRPVGGGIRQTSKESFDSRVVAILFADAVDFSKLAETEVPRFVQHFLGAIAQLSNQFADSIIAKNTWGDGLYFVFSDVDLAGNFALQLADLVTKQNWEKKALPRGLNLRIALHAGPVYEFDDPITGNRSYSGTHVSRAARIEPITPPGQVYASEAFAALSAAQRTRDFTCDYVGQTPMAKGYGTLPMYHVRWSSVAARL
jgi:class 3 adenylate cyclase/tetratricopeptide (TPR) repeat protein